MLAISVSLSSSDISSTEDSSVVVVVEVVVEDADSVVSVVVTTIVVVEDTDSISASSMATEVVEGSTLIFAGIKVVVEIWLVLTTSSSVFSLVFAEESSVFSPEF